MSIETLHRSKGGWYRHETPLIEVANTDILLVKNRVFISCNPNEVMYPVLSFFLLSSHDMHSAEHCDL